MNKIESKITLPDSIREAVERKCRRTGMTFDQVISEAVKADLQKAGIIPPDPS
jgi:ribosome-associated translation inhibitor RaiA